MVGRYMMQKETSNTSRHTCLWAPLLRCAFLVGGDAEKREVIQSFHWWICRSVTYSPKTGTSKNQQETHYSRVLDSVSALVYQNW